MSEPFQRDRVEDPISWRHQVEALRTEIEESPEERDPRKLGRLGDLLRIGGHAEESIPLLREALEHARARDDRLLVRANTIRLATALQYQGSPEKGRGMLEELLVEIEDSRDLAYLDFCLQHLGKILAEEGEWESAARCFHRAWELRRGKPAQESSRQALDEAIRRLPDGTNESDDWT